MGESSGARGIGADTGGSGSGKSTFLTSTPAWDPLRIAVVPIELALRAFVELIG